MSVDNGLNVDALRCTRNCFNCPVCTAPLAVSTLDPEAGGTAGPWILACEYCNWTSLDIDIQFDRPNGIHTQLSRILSGKQGQAQSKRSLELDSDDISEPIDGVARSRTISEAQFSNMLSFYNSEFGKINVSHPLMSPTGDINYGSPSSLQRIMALYTNQVPYGKTSKSKPTLMRESADEREGRIPIDSAAEIAVVDALRSKGLSSTTNQEQRTTQVHETRFVADLKPVPTMLRTKRSRRCRTCRHILVKPDQKVTGTRFRIKLVALDHIPSMMLKPLSAVPTPAFDLTALPPSRPLQLLLTLTNPMFDSVKVTLATPSQTPGRFSSRVTILCPQFEIARNTDVWDEALGENKRSSRLIMKSRRPEEASEREGKVAEAGKIWEKGRNWTTIVLEIVCARIQCPDEEVEEDEDVVEVPIFVRLEYEADSAEEGGEAKVDKEKREKRELAYWAVIGVGRIARGSRAAATS